MKERSTPSCSDWVPLQTLKPEANNQVDSLVVDDDGTGAALYAGGWFTEMDGMPVNPIARWDGTSWSGLGSQPDGTNGFVGPLAVLDDGRGPEPRGEDGRAVLPPIAAARRRAVCAPNQLPR